MIKQCDIKYIYKHYLRFKKTSPIIFLRAEEGKCEAEEMIVCNKYSDLRYNSMTAGQDQVNTTFPSCFC